MANEIQDRISTLEAEKGNIVMKVFWGNIFFTEALPKFLMEETRPSGQT